MADIRYNAAPPFRNTFFDLLAEALIGGKIQFSRADDHGIRLAVYKSDQFIAPAQAPEAYPNPLIIDATGVGAASTPPIYFSSETNYFIEIFTADAVIGVDSPIQTIGDWNAPENNNPTPGGDDVDITNYIINPDFTTLMRRGFDKEALPASETKIAEPEWYFERSNASAEVSIEFEDFVPGQADVPDQPPTFLTFSSNTPGSGETTKDVYFRILDVRSFNADQITIAFYAKSSSLSQLEILINQNFGPAGSTAVPTTVATKTLTVDWVRYSFTATVPSIAGKSIDPDDDGFVEIRFRMPLNAVSSVNLVKAQLNRGAFLLEYNYLPERYTTGKALGVNVPPPVFIRSEENEKYIVTTNGLGSYQWEAYPFAGSTMDWFTEVIPDGWLKLDGEKAESAYFPRLSSLLGVRYGRSAATATVLSDTVTVTSLDNGNVTDAADVSIGFTINTTQQGTAGLPEIFTVGTVVASAITPGTYFTFSTIFEARDWYVYAIIDGEGTDPALGGKTRLPLRLNGSDTADQVAAKLHTIMNPIMFGLPDTRGYIFRGVDDGVGRDPDAGTRTARPDGVGGDNVGTTQADEFKSHIHDVPITSVTVQSGAGATFDVPVGGGTPFNTTATGGAETRGINIYVFKIMKY